MKLIHQYTLLLLLICSSCSDKKQSSLEIENLDELISFEEVQDKSLKELRLIRNEIFARNGYRFNSTDLNKHFNQFDWYVPTHNKADSMLSDIDKKNVALILELENAIKTTINEDQELYSQFEAFLKTAYEDYQISFTNDLLITMDKFKGRKRDTTILTIGNIDGLNNLDTISTRVYVQNDTVFVDNSWTRNNELMWRDKYYHPFALMVDEPLFQKDKNNWVSFQAGLRNGPPVFYKEGISRGSEEMLWSIASRDMKSNGFEISRDAYFIYLDSTQANLIEYDDGYPTGYLMIWYEPLKRFVKYYAP